MDHSVEASLTLFDLQVAGIFFLFEPLKIKPCMLQHVLFLYFEVQLQ